MLTNKHIIRTIENPIHVTDLPAIDLLEYCSIGANLLLIANRKKQTMPTNMRHIAIMSNILNAFLISEMLI